MTLAEKVLEGDIQSAARLITLLEDENGEAEKEMEVLYRHTGKAYIVGVTGAPGVGKSTLTDNLIGYFRNQKMTVGVIAIDPTSALTGGALLGDRIRMQRHAADEGVFIRSLATRGWVGGLAKAALGTAHIMDAMGKDIVIIETVGSGQIELDIVKAADTTVLVLSPDSGDEIQTMKAGIIESADVFIVNKADKEGAERLKSDLQMMLSLKPAADGGWTPPIILTQAVRGKGTAELGAALQKHHDFIASGDKLLEKRRARVELELMETLVSNLKAAVLDMDGGWFLKRLVDALQKGRSTPEEAAREILDRFMNRRA